MSIVESDTPIAANNAETNTSVCCNEAQHHKHQIIRLKLSGAASYPCLGSPRRISPISPSRGDLSPTELSATDSCSGNRYKRLLFAKSNNQSVRSGLSVILESQNGVGEE